MTQPNYKLWERIKEEEIEAELEAEREFERSIIRERTIAGLERARAEGKRLGRPRKISL